MFTSHHIEVKVLGLILLSSFVISCLHICVQKLSLQKKKKLLRKCIQSKPAYQLQCSANPVNLFHMFNCKRFLRNSRSKRSKISAILSP